MKLIYAQGFSKSEKEEWRAIIFNNILSAFKVILDAMEELGIEFDNKENDVSVFNSRGRHSFLCVSFGLTLRMDSRMALSYNRMIVDHLLINTSSRNTLV
jgi:hypothetical protein